MSYTKLKRIVVGYLEQKIRQRHFSTLVIDVVKNLTLWFLQ